MTTIEEAWAEAVRPGYCESLRKQRLLALGRAVLEEAEERLGRYIPGCRARGESYEFLLARLEALAGKEPKEDA